MESVNPTRSALLAKRAQIRLATQGRDLLQEKRDALWKELMQAVSEVMRGTAEVEQTAMAARDNLRRALAFDGREAVQSAIFAVRRHVAIDITATNVLGVQIPIIERKRLVRAGVDRGYGLVDTSSRIDAAAEDYERLLEQVIELAAVELRLRRLAEEVRKTSTRVNALDSVLLPRLEGERAAIERVLDEREREDLFRLKRVKARLRAATA